MKHQIPKFESEAEEAKWWDDHKEELENDIFEKLARGEFQVLTKERLTQRIQQARDSERISLCVSHADLQRARELAAKRGLDYHTFMQELVHEALSRAE